MKKRVVLFVLPAVFLIAFQGCAFFGFEDKSDKRIYKTAEQLVDQGSFAYETSDYKEALQAFEQLKDWYPFSKYAILAELRIADCHYELEQYDEAIFAYTDFESLHPRNEAIPRIIYRRGMCWYNRVDTIDRDNKPAAQTIIQFKRLKERFPDSPYADKVDEKIEKCINNLAGHELYVADFYYKKGDYRAALNRYKYLVENFPTSDFASDALNKISMVKTKVTNKEN